MDTITDNQQNPRGTVLVCHGLNLKPTKMAALASLFEQRGFATEKIILQGHNPSDSLDDFRNVSAERWRQQLADALRQPPLDQGRVAVLAFSLGAACYLAALSTLWMQGYTNYREPDFHILLAPALATHSWTHATTLLAALPRLVIPSASPKDYRCHRGTPVAAYTALFGLTKDIRSAVDRGFRLYNPVLFIVNPKDELVSTRKCRRMLDILTNGRYETLLINNVHGRTTPKFAHLVLDPESLGEIQFQIVADGIQNFVTLV